MTVPYITFNINKLPPADDASQGVTSKGADDSDLKSSRDCWPLLYDVICPILKQLGLAFSYDWLNTISALSFREHIVGTKQFIISVTLFLLPVIYMWFWSSNIVLFYFVFSFLFVQIVLGISHSFCIGFCQALIQHEAAQNVENQHVATQNVENQHLATQNVENQHGATQYVQNQHAETQNVQNQHAEAQQDENQGAEIGGNEQPIQPNWYQVINLTDILGVFWTIRVLAFSIYSLFRDTMLDHSIYIHQ